MLGALGARLRDGEIHRDEVVRSACIESLLIHARVLRDFFLGKARRNDIDRMMFTGGVDWTPAEAVARLEARKDSLDKFLAHLTWNRIDWDLPAFDHDAVVSQRADAETFKLLATLRTEAAVDTVDDWQWTGPTEDFSVWCERFGWPRLANEAAAFAAARKP